MPLIQSLILKRDNAEIIRDKIAEILIAERDSQMDLALLEVPPEDPEDWNLRVFIERVNPWEEFLDLPGTAENPTRVPPIVNVSRDSESFDMSAGNIVERQRSTGIYFIDCYGYGVAESDGSGHTSGDQNAAVECQRAVRLVRNILMSATHAYLDMRGVVARRWPQSIQSLELPSDVRSVQQIAAMRISLQVDFNEFAPQVEGEESEVVSVTVRRAENDEVYFVSQYGEES